MPTLVATVGAANANSFVTLDEASTYFDERPDSEHWLCLGSDDQTRSLLYAAKQLSQMAWMGQRVTDTQALPWPRYDVCKPDGWGYFETTVIPQQIKDAQCELAYQVGSSASLTSSSSQGVITSFREGDVSISYDTASLAPGVVTTSRSIVDGLLMGLVRSGVQLERA